MQAVILAAGMGKRLGNLTKNGTKCLVKVNGKALIEYAIESLLAANIEKIIIVVGHEAEGLIKYINNIFPVVNIEYVTNPVFDKTNNIYSLWLAREYFRQDDTILLESDVIFDSSIIDELVNNEDRDVALVSKFESWMDGTVAVLDESDSIVSVIDKKHFKWGDTGDYYKTVNVYKFSKEFSTQHYLPFVEAYLASLGANEYYEQVLKVIVFLENSGLKGMRISARRWYEIDDPHDLHIAETLFAGPGKKIPLIEERYGGYWRFPGLIDFCYLVNPFFPTTAMWDELGSSFREVSSQYPSGMKIQSILGGKIFQMDPEYIAVGNGAAELISSLFRLTEGRVGIVSPCFNEYQARIGEARTVRHETVGDNFSYSSGDLVRKFEGNVEWSVLVNPDNPSGHFLRREELEDFVNRCADAGIRPIVDESFVDFADPELRFSLMDEAYLRTHPELLVIRSISKSYGIPGLRLGVIASSDTVLISKIKKDVAIWNINSMGEYFLQIFDKYKSYYHSACDQVATERRLFAEDLSSIPGINVYPSQANYLFCRLDRPISASGLAEYLLESESMLIKNLKNKTGFEGGEYIRLAVRTREDNRRVVSAARRFCLND